MTYGDRQREPLSRVRRASYQLRVPLTSSPAADMSERLNAGRILYMSGGAHAKPYVEQFNCPTMPTIIQLGFFPETRISSGIRTALSCCRVYADSHQPLCINRRCTCYC